MIDPSKLNLRNAEDNDSEEIWQIISDAKERMRKAGSLQWQDGYPKPETIHSDINNGVGLVLCKNEKIVAYAALIFAKEQAYEMIEGKWLTNDDYAVVHRMAVAENYTSKGIAANFFEHIEQKVIGQNVFSLRVDTNFDNHAMLAILQKRGYVYCGEVYFRGSARKAFEKILKK